MTGLRYLITYSDGGSGMRHHAEPLEVGDTVEDGGSRYRVTAVVPPPSEAGFGERARNETCPKKRRSPEPTRVYGDPGIGSRDLDQVRGGGGRATRCPIGDTGPSAS